MPKLEQPPLEPAAKESSDGWRAPTIDALIKRFELPLVRYAARITGDAERARDCVQETFLRYCREQAADSRTAISNETHLAQWLFTVCRRLALDVRRKETRMKTGSDGNTAVCERANTHAVSLEQEEQFARVLGLLTLLPTNQQEVVRLKFQSQLSYKQIAGVTGLTVTNVGFLLHTAIKTLRDRLQEA